MYSHKTNTDAALDSFRRGVSERWSNILRNLLPRGQISWKIQILPGWEICLVRGEDFQRQWCNSFTTELVQKLAKTPKANVIL